MGTWVMGGLGVLRLRRMEHCQIGPQPRHKVEGRFVFPFVFLYHRQALRGAIKLAQEARDSRRAIHGWGKT